MKDDIIRLLKAFENLREVTLEGEMMLLSIETTDALIAIDKIFMELKDKYLLPEPPVGSRNTTKKKTVIGRLKDGMRNKKQQRLIFI